MSRKGWLILLAALLAPGVLLVGAFVFMLRQSESPHPIPDGVYRAASGDELVAIEGSRIRFVVHGTDPAPTNVVVKEYEYTVHKDGELVTYLMATGEAVFGPIGRYDWFWDGEVITRRRLEQVGRNWTDLEPPMTFIRSAEPPKD